MFSRYDVYTTVQSIYCYPDSDILKNKLDIRDREKLRRAEEEFTAVKQFVLLREPIQGRYKLSRLFFAPLKDSLFPPYRLLARRGVGI